MFTVCLFFHMNVKLSAYIQDNNSERGRKKITSTSGENNVEFLGSWVASAAMNSTFIFTKLTQNA